MSMPTVFVSHGAPTMALEPGAAGEAMRRLGQELPRPKAILMVSAHWETPSPTLSTAARPETIHDFYGFPEALYRLHYAAPGAPDLAQRAAQLLQQAGISAQLDAQRGLDHGAWVPLRYLHPQADVPVTQLSIQPQLSPLHHYRMGEALRPLTQEGVLIVASGSLTHNLREFRGRGQQVADYVRAFQGWVWQALEAHDLCALIDYRTLAPEAVRAHPTDEHFLPLFVALGAAGAGGRVQRLTDEVTFGVIAMDGYVFGEREAVVN
ncbi:MAG: dioxygenase [Burkholderiales bacterium]|nr:dioxygenase [Burkholderiales bacterium]